MNKFFILITLLFFLYLVAEALVLYKCQNPFQDDDFQYIILLGANGRTDSPLVIDRTRMAIDAMKRWPNARLVISGNAERNEVEAFKTILAQEGFLPGNFITEEKSSTTWENLKNTKQLIEPNAKILLITNEFHQPRALAIARTLNLRASIYGNDPREYQFALQYWVRERFATLKFLAQFFASFFAA